MLEKFQKLLDRIESRIALWTIIQGSGILTVAGVTGWLSNGVGWIRGYGPFGWWVAALFGALLFGCLLFLISWARHAWFRASAIQRWSKQVDSINPLDPEFHNKRINLLDIVSPIDNSIANKRFVGCELIGPANLVFVEDNHVTQVAFVAHDFILLNERPRVVNAIRVINSTIIGGSLHKVTILVHPTNVPQNFLDAGANWISARPSN